MDAMQAHYIVEVKIMETIHLGIIMNGVTGRMGTNQHLERSIMAIRKEGGLGLSDGRRILPEPILVGRNAEKLRSLSERYGDLPWTTDLDEVLGDSAYPLYFDALTTEMRVDSVKQAIAAGKHVYCEKPIATNTQDALTLYQLAEEAGIKHGVVQDKLWLPGLMKLKHLVDDNFFGRIYSVRAEFGYWVFDGKEHAMQRPSWNYQKQYGGGIMLDMLCHWRYVIDNIFGDVQAISCLGATHIEKRIDEAGTPFDVDVDDAAYAAIKTMNEIICQFNFSWATRVHRDDLLVLHVDGEKGSAVAGLTHCRVQAAADTPCHVWNPDTGQQIHYQDNWKKVFEQEQYTNAFKAQWELFLKHVVAGDAFRWNLLEGAKGIQLAELGMASWHQRKWMDIEPLVK